MKFKLMVQILSLQIQVLMLQVQVLTKKLEERLAIYRIAHASLGIDISPLDAVNDELGCAESVSWVLKKAIGFPIITGTWTLNKYLSEDPRFEKVYEPEPGIVIISPTGTGNGSISGHTGICGENDNIMSSDSSDGIWKLNFTQYSWVSRYGKWGGFPIIYYRLKVVV